MSELYCNIKWITLGVMVFLSLSSSAVKQFNFQSPFAILGDKLSFAKSDQANVDRIIPDK